MILSKPAVFRREDSYKFEQAKPTKALYKGLKKAEIAERNGKYANFDWVKEYFK